MSKGRSVSQQEVLDRTFEGLAVRDAQAELRLFASAQDIEGAVPGDPENCVFARSCKRQFGSTAVVIMQSIAYVDMPQEDGSRVVERYQISPAAKNQIVTLDRDKESPLSGGFTLKPPRPSMRLDARKQANRKHYKKRQTARIKGEAVEKRSRPDVLTLEGVRSGIGMVHFRRTKDAA